MISTTNHISQKFDQALAKLYKRLDQLGNLTVTTISDTQLLISALAENQPASVTGELKDKTNTLKNKLQATEAAIKQIFLMEMAIDEACERILALYQPVASDLRTVITVIRVLSEIQAIANALEQIIKLVKRLRQSESPKSPEATKAAGSVPIKIVALNKLNHLVKCIASLTELVMQAVAQADISESEQIAKQYKVTKRSRKRLLKLLSKTELTEDKNPVHSFRFAQELSRIINHVKLIIGHLIYLNEGTGVRHLSFKQMREILELGLDDNND